MQDSFDVFEYVDFLRARWKFPAFACGFAILVALVVGLLLPKRYTVTATILIDPPAGGDPRVAAAVSTVYLESLKTYELLATNDQLFVRAADIFHLRDQGESIESLKRRVLKVDKPRDTRALQISVTLSDPKIAQAMAQFIADGAVELNRLGGKEAGDAMIQDATKAADAAKARLNEAESAWQMAAGVHSEEALRSEIYAIGDLKSHVEEQLLDEQDGQSAQRGRTELLERRSKELTRSLDEKSAELAQQTAREQNLEAVLTGARTLYETAAQRLADASISPGSRTEWLRVVDPGIVPQRPSSPNVPLILIGAGALALFGSLLYLTTSFSLTRRRLFDRPLRMATHGDD
jgi:succinoglycan biosynthesis transport protein ExoP